MRGEHLQKTEQVQLPTLQHLELPWPGWLRTYINTKLFGHLPKNLNGAPQIENEEHNWLVVHFLQTTKNDEEDKIPSDHLGENQNPQWHLIMKS